MRSDSIGENAKKDLKSNTCVSVAFLKIERNLIVILLKDRLETGDSSKRN